MIGGYNHYFHEEIVRRVNAKRQERMESLANGACVDFADYRCSIGYFEGLKETLEIADEIKREYDRA